MEREEKNGGYFARKKAKGSKVYLACVGSCGAVEESQDEVGGMSRSSRRKRRRSGRRKKAMP